MPTRIAVAGQSSGAVKAVDSGGEIAVRFAQFPVSFHLRRIGLHRNGLRNLCLRTLPEPLIWSRTASSQSTPLPALSLSFTPKNQKPEDGRRRG